jgi:hypothetical protein
LYETTGGGKAASGAARHHPFQRPRDPVATIDFSTIQAQASGRAEITGRDRDAASGRVGVGGARPLSPAIRGAAAPAGEAFLGFSPVVCPG